MNKKAALLALLIFATSANASFAKGRRDKTQNTIEANYREIDNYDFLYSNENSSFSNAMTNDIVDEAFTHLGARYQSGCKGPYAFDCSGFTSYVFGLNNFNIGNSSRAQYAQNLPISRSEMHRGDLVFFSSPSSGNGVGHVGIVVDVNGNGTFNFIHASTSQGVTISSSSDGYYSNHYIGERRVLQTVSE